MKTSLTYKKEGSVIAITLVFIAVLMATVIGVSFLLSKLLSSGTLVVDGIKAGYNTESSLELALYQLKVRREGFEDKRDITIAEGKGNYEIKYSTPALEKIEHTFEPGRDTLSLALYRDIPPNIVDINEGPFDIKLLIKQATTVSSGDCARMRLIGRKGDQYQAISKTYRCSPGNTPASIIGDKDDSARLLGSNTTTLSFEEFIRTHEEVKMEIKDLKQDASNALLVTVVTGTGNTSKDIAGKHKIITATGSSGNVVIKKQVETLQDQVLNLLTNSFSLTK